MVIKLAGALVVAVALGSGAAIAQVAGVDGVWSSEDGEGYIEVADCTSIPGAKCGSIVWIKSPLDAAGKPIRDAKNADPALQKRALCGVEVVSAMVPSADGGFAGGTVYDPEEGKTYKGSIKVEGGALKITGYIETPIKPLSDTDTLTRVSEPFERCSAKK